MDGTLLADAATDPLAVWGVVVAAATYVGKAIYHEVRDYRVRAAGGMQFDGRLMQHPSVPADERSSAEQVHAIRELTGAVAKNTNQVERLCEETCRATDQARESNHRLANTIQVAMSAMQTQVATMQGMLQAKAR